MLKVKPKCEKCGREFTEHTIETIRGSLEWVCPQLKEESNGSDSL